MLPMIGQLVGMTAPCDLDKKETSGDGENWPGSPCLIEKELCLNCGAITERGQKMKWINGYPVEEGQ